MEKNKLIKSVTLTKKKKFGEGLFAVEGENPLQMILKASEFALDSFEKAKTENKEIEVSKSLLAELMAISHICKKEDADSYISHAKDTWDLWVPWVSEKSKFNLLPHKNWILIAWADNVRKDYEKDPKQKAIFFDIIIP